MGKMPIYRDLDASTVMEENGMLLKTSTSSKAGDVISPEFYEEKFVSQCIVDDRRGGTITFNADSFSDNVGVTVYNCTIYNIDGKVVKSLKGSVKNNIVTIRVPKLDAGRYFYEISASDKAKNSMTTDRFHFSVTDETAPKSGKVKALQGADAITLTMSGFSDAGGLDHFAIKMNGKECGSVVAQGNGSGIFSCELGTLAGKLNFEVVAVDLAGHASKTVKTSLRITDKISPALTGTLNQQENVTDSKGGEITFSSDAFSDNVEVAAYSVTVYRAGGAVKSFKGKTANGVVTVKISKLSAGDYTYVIAASDKARNTGYSCELQLRVTDGTAPTGGKLKVQQLSGSEVKLTFGNFKDNVGVDHYEIYLNNRKFAESAEPEYLYQSESALGGQLTFSVIAVDAMGNASKAIKNSLKIKDMTPPDAVTGLVVTRNGNGVALSWNSAEDNSGKISCYEVFVDGQKKTTVKGTSAVIKGLSQDTHTFKVRAYDAAKNAGEWSNEFKLCLKKAYLLPDGDGGEWTAQKGDVNAVEVSPGYDSEATLNFFEYEPGMLTIRSAAQGSEEPTKFYGDVTFGSEDDQVLVEELANFCGSIAFGNGNNLLQIASHRAMGSNKIATTFGRGNDTILIGPNSKVTMYDLDLGKGYDTVEIQTGARVCGGSWIFGDGQDTLVLNGQLQISEELTGLEKVSGNGQLLISQRALDGGFDVSLFANAGIKIVNCGNHCDTFTSPKQELADNTRKTAVSLDDWFDGHSKQDLYLCGKDGAAKLQYGFADEEDWLSLKIRWGQENGYTCLSIRDWETAFGDVTGNPDLTFELYEANGSDPIATYADGSATIDFGDYADGTYYLRCRVDSSSGPISVHGYREK